MSGQEKPAAKRIYAAVRVHVAVVTPSRVLQGLLLRVAFRLFTGVLLSVVLVSGNCVSGAPWLGVFRFEGAGAWSVLGASGFAG